MEIITNKPALAAPVSAFLAAAAFSEDEVVDSPAECAIFALDGQLFTAKNLIARHCHSTIAVNANITRRSVQHQLCCIVWIIVIFLHIHEAEKQNKQKQQLQHLPQ